MPYCQRCGTQLEENARFCHKCGTHVVIYSLSTKPQYQSSKTSAPLRPIHKDPLIVVVIGLVVILLTAAIVVTFVAAPLEPWDSNVTLVDNSPNVRTLNLNFDTNIGAVSIITLKAGIANNLLINVQVNGSRGLLGNINDPFITTFDNQTIGDTLTVNSRVEVKNSYNTRANVAVQIYVNPDLELNLNVSSITGRVSFSADKPATIQNLKLKATTGEVEANLQGTITLIGDISLQTTTGAVNFRTYENTISGNRTINLKSTTGSINMDITQTKTLDSNLNVNADATTGSVNLELIIDGSVSAKIISDKPSFGNIETNLKNFSGNDTLLHSNNYPAIFNIDFHNRVTTGSINIGAAYQTTTFPS